MKIADEDAVLITKSLSAEISVPVGITLPGQRRGWS